MTVSIYRADFFHGKTILHSVHVPNWFERVVLRKKRTFVTYQGHKKTWKVNGNRWAIGNSKAAELEKIEKKLSAKAKAANTKTLKFL